MDWQPLCVIDHGDSINIDYNEGAITNVALVASNNTMCMTYAIPHPDALD
jgi:hypothetical protein